MHTSKAYLKCLSPLFSISLTAALFLSMDIALEIRRPTRLSRGRSAKPQLWPRQKYLKNFWLDRHKICININSLHRMIIHMTFALFLHKLDVWTQMSRQLLYGMP